MKIALEGVIAVRGHQRCGVVLAAVAGSISLSLISASCGMSGGSNGRQEQASAQGASLEATPSASESSLPAPHVQPPAKIDERFGAIFPPPPTCTVLIVGPTGRLVFGLIESNIGRLFGTEIFCLTGFIPDQSVSVAVEGPAGNRQDLQGTTDAIGSADVTWTSDLEDPVGPYTVTATQGGGAYADSFELEDAQGALSKVTSVTGPPDAGFEVVFYKYPPGLDLSLFLYHVDAEGTEGEGFDRMSFVTYGYVATLAPSVQTDAEGTLVFPIEGVTLSVGSYCVFYAEKGDTSISEDCLPFDVEP